MKVANRALYLGISALSVLPSFSQVFSQENVAATIQENQAVISSIILDGDESGSASNAQKGIVVRNLKVPGGTRRLMYALEPFLGKELNREALSQIKETLLKYYREAGHSFILVKIPEQDVTSGSVRYILVEGKIENLIYRGNRWFSNKSLGRFIHERPGEAINQEHLLNDMASVNRNPFHYTEAILTPGKKNGFTDIELVTEDRFPLRVYGVADNTGLDSTGKSRYTAGFNWGNVWGISDLLSYQWTTASSPRLFNSHYLGYTSFLSWYHTLTVFGGYAEIHPDIRDFSSEGKSVQASLRYAIPFKPLYKPRTQQVFFGFDFKRTNSDLFFAEAPEALPLVTHAVNLTQLIASYQLEDIISRHKISFNVDLYGSPGKWLPDQKNSDFNNLRPHAKNRYLYGRLSFGNIYTLPKDFSIMGLLRLQGATGALLPSEQFGLGGYNTVRGYDERDFDADDAACLNLEIRSPEMKIFSPKNKNKFSFLLFFDYGWGHNYHNELVGIGSTEHLMSVGSGFRFLIYPYLSVRADYGFQLHHIPFSHDQTGKFHFSVSAGY